MPDTNYIVFTDLDGTLLDHHTYASTESLPGLELLRRHKIPLVFCSAKTRAEQVVHRRELDVHDPFIVENGGGIFFERGYFKKQNNFVSAENGFYSLSLARSRIEVRRILAEVRGDLNLPVRGYGDMTVNEVSKLTGLNAAAAKRAMQREFEETIVTPLSSGDRERFRIALARRGISMTNGARFISISTANDKGRAARLLMDLFRRERPGAVSVGIGDSWNDAPLLAATDIRMLVQQPAGKWASLEVEGLRRINGVGPKGWTLAMKELMGNGHNS